MSSGTYYSDVLYTYNGQSCDSVYDLSNDTDEDLAYLVTPRHTEVMYLYILPTVLIIGLASNLAFMFVVLRLKRMRTITNFYLINLAIADICYLSTGVLEKMARTVISPLSGDQGMFGQAACIIVYSLLNTASFASLFLVTLVTAEKFYAVCFPLKHRRITGIERTIKLVIFCWCLALVFAASLVPSFYLIVYICVTWPDRDIYHDFPPHIGACWAVSDAAVNTAHGMQTIPFFLAIVPNTIMYIKIVKALHVRVAVSEELRNSREKSLRMRNQVARMLVVNGTLFFLLAAPFHVLSFVLMVASPNPEEHGSLLDAIDSAIPSCQLLLYMNSVVNPFVYSATNSRYRDAYLQTFCWKGTKIGPTPEMEIVEDREPQQRSGANVNTISTGVS